MNKKKIAVVIIAVVLVVSIVGGAIAWNSFKFIVDFKDTEDVYRTNVEAVNYENTIETAMPQTDLYGIINEHFNSALPEGKTEKKAIVIGYDGCRADILNEIQSENSAIASLVAEGASLKLAYCGGVNYPEKNTQDTSTAPGWCSILTGEWADKTGITANDIVKSVEPKTLLTTLVEDGKAESSLFVTRWAGHFSRDEATYVDEMKYCEDNNLAVTFNKCDNDEKSLEYTLDAVSKENCQDFIFVIYEPTDSTGHDYGFSYNNPRYKEAFVRADAYALETINAIKGRASYAQEDWLIILTSDHGGFGSGHGNESIQERMTFVVSTK
ncbi:MAG: alkaline phosphatase family protein [Clostridia bacterium]|nr:alkaline phosphatase family protein [Clostridia bacterium]